MLFPETSTATMSGQSASFYGFLNPVNQIKNYKAHCDKDSTSILEIKRTTGKHEFHQLRQSNWADEMPVSILPGSLHQYSIKMDRNQQYSVTRKVPRTWRVTKMLHFLLAIFTYFASTTLGCEFLIQIHSICSKLHE